MASGDTGRFPDWMHEVLSRIVQGKEPIAEFKDQATAGRVRLQFYRFLKAEREKGNELARDVAIQWRAKAYEKSKTVLVFVHVDDSNPLLDSESEEETADDIECARIVEESRRKYGGKK